MAKILMIDDDRDQAATAKQWLGLEEHSVDLVYTGGKGWEALEADQFDLVILDWDLPDIQGIDILRRYRAGGGTKPIIMLTGRANVDSKTEGLDGGADDYLTKPYHMKELAARIRLVLRKQDSQPKIPKALGEGNEELLAKADLLGTTLPSRYEFLSLLGEGGVGLVLKAMHPHLKKIVAVKMIQNTELKQETIDRFSLEAQVIAQMEHPNIATVYDFGITERKQPYMVMEFVEGKSLFDALKENDCLPVEEALTVTMQICDGMAHAHGMGVLHRDLKPSNIILKPVTGGNSVVKILDFGCAKLRHRDGQEKPQALTRATEIIGSPPYMSPEQIQGGQMDERSDIYSLGCLLFEILTGYVPHLGNDAVETLVKHLKDEVLPLKKARPQATFPTDLDFIVAKALDKEPARRFQSMLELKAELEKMKLQLQQPEANGKWWDIFGKLKKASEGDKTVKK
jgi:CheY-like chemotaxis protein